MTSVARSARLPAGGDRIDRSRELTFSYENVVYTAFAGDSLASALLANGVDCVSRSLYRGRPRGIMTAGMEEPNALVRVRSGAREESMLRATTVEVVDGLEAWSLAGKGRLAPGPDAARFDKGYAHRDVLVVGGGVPGRSAAINAARSGERVMLVHDGPCLDPEIVEGARSPALDLVVLARTTALGIYDHGYAIAVQRNPSTAVAGRLWHVRARSIVLATGATERPIVFADNDRPGVMLASAAAKYVTRYGVRPGERAVIFTTNDSTDVVARVLAAASVEIAEVVDARRGEAIIATDADDAGRLSAMTIGRRDGGGGHRRIEADLLLVSGGWNPSVNLWSQSRGTLRFDPRIAAFVPDRAFGAVSVVGEAAGIGLPDVDPLWIVPAVGVGSSEARASSFIDLERDATVADLHAAVDAGLTSIEHLKRYTTIGTGSDQGKTSGVVTSAIAAMLLGEDPGSVGVPTYRPPYIPVTFAQLAGRERGMLFDPVRTTPIHAAHLSRGAVFENVGQWKRARYYPRHGESMEAAVLRECTAARNRVAVIDVATLGKIDIQGADAGVFLDRVYANTFSTLRIGSCRYGIMCDVNGMVFDDGVTSRVGDHRFLMTTTTGNAAPVMDHLEEWLQTEWPSLRVRATSVTEQWCAVAIVGPRSRDVVSMLAPHLDVSRSGFPFMTWRDAEVGGTAARIFRISFSGELAYEVNVPWWSGMALWDAVLAAGERFGITPYGTEALHVLRAEKGYPIIGQETDGSVTPDDLGMSSLVSTRKDFIGRRSLRRSDLTRAARKQLVGLLPVDPNELLPEGAQLVATDADLSRVPVPMLGHVTSSYRSAALERTFALALIKGGRARIGETVRAPLIDRVVDAVVTSSVLFDPENLRRDGAPDL